MPPFALLMPTHRLGLDTGPTTYDELNNIGTHWVVSRPAPGGNGDGTTTLMWPGESFLDRQVNFPPLGFEYVISRWDGMLEVMSDKNNIDASVILPIPLSEGQVITEASLVAHIPIGDLDGEFVRYPIDGSPRVVLATFSFSATGGRTTDTVILGAPETVDGGDTYSVEITAPDLDKNDIFQLFAFTLLADISGSSPALITFVPGDEDPFTGTPL